MTTLLYPERCGRFLTLKDAAGVPLVMGKTLQSLRRWAADGGFEVADEVRAEQMDLFSTLGKRRVG